jgi:hypothetical protein
MKSYLKRKKQRGGNELQNIITANRNLELKKKLEMPKPPRQPLGQIVNFTKVYETGRKRKRKKQQGAGPALVDPYGAYINAF